MVRRSSTPGLTQMRRFEVFIIMYKKRKKNFFPAQRNYEHSLQRHSNIKFQVEDWEELHHMANSLAKVNDRHFLP